MAITNATRLSDFAAGIGTAGAILQIDNANQRIGIGTQLPSQMLEVAGIVSATQFIGDGSQLEGITSAGLGTAIGDSSAVEEVIYYTNDLLNVTETTTINPPASASAAYTQYRDVKLEDSVDLIIETGDDFIPDILGFGDDTSDPNAAGNGVFDEVYTDIIKNKNGLGAPTFANGFTSVGVGTFNSDASIAGTLSVTGNVSVGGTLTYEDVKNIDSVGLITARSGIRVTGGDVGIGLDNPDSLLHISKGTNTDDGAVTFTIGGISVNTRQSTITKNNLGSSNRALEIRAATGNSHETIKLFSDNTTERIRIGQSGQIGLGGANYGTSGQVLTSQGAGSAAQWATPSGGSWEVVSTHVLAGSDSTLDFNNWSNAYQKYQLVFNDVYCNHSNFHIYFRIFKDATSGNTGTLMTQSNGYASNATNTNITSSGISGTWSGWVGYHKLGANNYGPLWHGTYDFYMGQPVSTPSGNNECTWIGQSMRERDISGTVACMYTQDKDKYLTGVRVYFIDANDGSSAMTPNGGRFTLYRMKYS